MADIALLIVEDYESRKTRSVKKEGEDLHLVSNCFSLLSQRGFDGISLIRKDQEKFDLAKKALDPKSELGLAAINGFFSA